MVLGVVRREGDRFFLTPVDKRERRELLISEMLTARPGDLVLAEPSGRPPRVTARIDAVLGDPFAARSFSMIAIAKHGLRDEFDERAIEEAHRVAKMPLGEREDLTNLPIVAIDPEDARDHDDAIWASPRADGEGWDAIVAIADVSFYVREGSQLDREALLRGNSVYFPDRVVPMLPHELSSDICSLKEGQVRAALACHMHIGKDGSSRSGSSRAPRFVSPQTLPMRMRRRRSTATAGLVEPEIVEQRAEAAVGLLEGVARGAHQARTARARPPRTPRRARRKRPHPVGRPARAARRPPPGRGLHDRRQRRRGQGAGEEKGAGDVPRPRGAEPRETDRAQGLSRHLRPPVRARAR